MSETGVVGDNVGAVVAIAGAVLIVGGGAALLLEWWFRLMSRNGMQINVSYRWWHPETHEEINRRADAADAKMFTRLRGRRPLWVGSVVVGFALVAVGALIDSRTL